jgi:DNA-binding GntR family transcriptional regulator
VFVRADYAGIALMIGRRTGTIYSWIEEMYGVHIGSVEQVLSTEAIPKAVASALGTQPENLGIAIQRTYRVTEGDIIEGAFNLHPAERFRYEVTLQRWD